MRDYGAIEFHFSVAPFRTLCKEFSVKNSPPPEKGIENFTLGGVMPASLKVLVLYDSHRQKDILVAGFGASAIRRVAPVDSGELYCCDLTSSARVTDYARAQLP
ncbi:hypothetical protein ACLOJK_028658 [Asimina triloba]